VRLKNLPITASASNRDELDAESNSDAIVEGGGGVVGAAVVVVPYRRSSRAQKGCSGGMRPRSSSVEIPNNRPFLLIL
jgi:hypothetical protein